MKNQPPLFHLGRKWLWFIPVLIFLSGCQARLACKDGIGCLQIPPGKPIWVAVERVNTGDEQAVSLAAIAGLQNANQAKPIFEGHPIKIYYQDAACLSKDRASTAGTLASQPDLIAVVGPFCQSDALIFGKLVSDAGILLISAAPLADFGDQPGWFSTYPSTLPLDSPAVTSDTAYDAYNLILHVLEEASITDSDGSLVIRRQGMRDAMSKIKDFTGLAGVYSCDSSRKCLGPEQFLSP
jgi:ABC-type branched-subunit amino acid transport system substrate-binding protein